MKTTRTYPSICTTCNGTGRIFGTNLNTNLYQTCPVCNGNKTIIITETIEP